MNKIVTAKRRLTDINFNAEGCHVALVDKAANGRSVLITKAADEVIVALSFEKFLMTFFDMWSVDASVLAQLMGYESQVYDAALMDDEKWDDSWNKDKIESELDSIMLLKSISNGDVKFSQLVKEAQEDIVRTQTIFEKNLSDIEISSSIEDFLEYINKKYDSDELTLKSVDSSKGFNSLTGEQQILFKLYQLYIDKGLLTGATSSKQDEIAPVGDNLVNKSTNNKGNNMSTDNKAVAPELAEIKKALDEQTLIIKALQDENVRLKDKEAVALKKELTEKAKQFKFVDEDKAEGVADLFKSLSEDNLVLVLDLFKKANDLIAEKEEDEKEGEMFTQKSVSGEDNPATPDEALKAQVNKALNIK